MSLKATALEVDPARVAAAELGTMVKAVVATGKVEPITKVEIKSKANGIIKVGVGIGTGSDRRRRRAPAGNQSLSSPSDRSITIRTIDVRSS